MSPAPPAAHPGKPESPSALHSGRATASNNESVQPHRPTHLGIHLLDERSPLLYVSSGVRQTMGFTPEQVINTSVLDFICDGYDSKDYMTLYEVSQPSGADTEADTDNGANAFVMYANLRMAHGPPVYFRITLFPCDNCVLYVCQAHHDVLLSQRHELEVQALDGEMRKLNITRERSRKSAEAATQPGGTRRIPLYSAQSKQVKAAFVLEHPAAAGIENQATGGRQAGPLVAFVTGSVSRLVDADTSDVIGAAFMKLVAPEDVLHVGKYFDRLADSTDVLFETFALLRRPYVIDGDIDVADHDNPRIVVECLGASSQDGLAILVRKLRTAPAPKRDSVGNYIHSRTHEFDDEGGYISLAELISSDPDTSDVPDAWSRLN